MTKLDKKYGHLMPSMGSYESSVEIDPSGVMVNKATGRGVNRLKKAKQWEHFSDASVRDAIDTAGKASRVYNKSKSPMALLGFGVKKRGRPRKHGGALFVAGA